MKSEPFWLDLPQIEAEAERKSSIYTTIHQQLQCDDGSLTECDNVEELAEWFARSFAFDICEVTDILNELRG